MLSYVYEFLSTLFDKLRDREKINAIVLFGSAARGTQREDSDIDLFIDCEKQHEKEIRTVVHESLNEFELRATKSWHLRGIQNPIVPIIGTLAEGRWDELRKEIEGTGVYLYTTWQEPTKRKRVALLTYDLSKCKQKQKMRVLRKLYGYKNKKGRKTYAKEGLVTKLKGEKLQNGIIVTTAVYKSLAGEFRGKGIPFTKREFWAI